VVVEKVERDERAGARDQRVRPSLITIGNEMAQAIMA